MAKKKTLTTMSADELFALAAKRQQEEEERQRDAVKSQIAELRAQRREVLARQKKELAQIDRQIKKLGGKSIATKRTHGSVTDTVLDIVSSAGKVSTADLKAELEQRGVVAGNLNQTLAYLKRQGRITSPSRAIYKIAK